MRRRRSLWAPGAGFLVALACLACDGAWLSFHEVANFREVEIEEARRIAAQPDARVIQAAPGPNGEQVPGAEMARPDSEWPPQIDGAGPVVILAGDPEDGYRLAALLARAGIQDIAVYAGDIGAWRKLELGESEEVAAARRTHSNPTEKE